jgi:opacity protein-like surface antigen
MKFSTKFALGFVAAIALATTASQAEAKDGWYVSGNLGSVTLQNSDVLDTIGGDRAVSATANVNFDTGYGLSGSIGHAWGLFRVEGELSYRKNDLGQLELTSVTAAGIGTFTGSLGTYALEGDMSSLGFMVNAYRDFKTKGKWAPFVMAGIGGASINLDVNSTGGDATPYDESDLVFAYQAGAGIGYNFTPTVSGNLQYRLFGTTDQTFDDGASKVETEYQNHNFMVGITKRF